MDVVEDILDVDDLTRDPKTIIRKLRRTGRPMVITIDGSPEAVLLSTELMPSKRIYDMPPQPTTEAGIHNSWRGDLYIVIGDEQLEGGAYAVRVYFNPLVRFIWIGALIMFLGGFASLSDRRLRIGAPARKAIRKEAVSA